MESRPPRCRNRTLGACRHPRRALSFRPSRSRTERAMQVESTNPNAGKHIPFQQEGWGFAFFVVMLAAASAGGAWYVHKTTYKSPNDVRFHAAGTTSAAEH
jgi:hypothetical protein